MAAPPPTRITLKLLIDPKMERVLLAEAPKNFIDLLFNLLRLPIGTIIRLLTKNDMVGCIAKLYESIENLSEAYFLNPKQHKEALLNPSVPSIPGCLLPYNDMLNQKEDKQIFPNPSSSTTSTEQSVIKSPPITPSPNPRTLKSRGARGLIFSTLGGRNVPSANNGSQGNNSSTRPSNLYTCLNFCNYYVTDVLGTPCPYCGKSMNSTVQYLDHHKTKEVIKSCGEGGFVNGLVAYTVMDDLDVHPMSTISTITLLSKFNIKDIASLQERVVDVGIEESIKLLKASLQCKNVLTSVFLKKVHGRMRMQV